MFDALFDLTALGLMTSRSTHFWQPTALGRIFLGDPIPIFEGICSAVLEADQVDVLYVINRVSSDCQLGFARVPEVPGEQLVAQVEWADDVALFKTVVQELKQRGMIGGFLALGREPSSVRAHATLRVLIWQTRRAVTQQSKWIDHLVEEWETTSVDFKRNVHLDTRDEEAEFVKDMLGVVNTQASGQRLLVLCFDPKTRVYVCPPNPKLTQDWIERVLINDTEPMVQAHYRIVEYRAGPVGIIEAVRDPRHLPYRVKRSIGDKKRIQEGQIFVRHGSQTEDPTRAELQALLDAGKRARGEPRDAETQK